MSTLWKAATTETALYFNNLQKARAEELSIIRFLEGHIQLSKAYFALRIAGLDHPGTSGKRASMSRDHPDC